MGKPKGKYAWTATVGEKGQIVIPKQAREIFDIHPGDTLVLLGDEKGGLPSRLKPCFHNLPRPYLKRNRRRTEWLFVRSKI